MERPKHLRQVSSAYYHIKTLCERFCPRGRLHQRTFIALSNVKTFHETFLWHFVVQRKQRLIPAVIECVVDEREIHNIIALQSSPLYFTDQLDQVLILSTNQHGFLSCFLSLFFQVDSSAEFLGEYSHGAVRNLCVHSLKMDQKCEQDDSGIFIRCTT